LSATLVYSGHVLYPTYEAVPRLWGVSAIDDQVAAGAIMWVPGSIAFLVPALWIAFGALDGAPGVRPGEWRARAAGSRTPLPGTRARPVRSRRRAWDLLEVRLVGSLLRRRAVRTTAQATTSILAVAIMLDGLLGPQVAPANLAGVLPWTHWRGLAAVGLLAAGNVFCFACPFTLPRGLAKQVLGGRRRWPRALRSKWLAAGLVVAYLWAYEAFALWDSPWWTAWVVVGYFAAAFVVDGLFEGASFCKYVCPIGQYHFVSSTVSPLEVKVRDTSVCRVCAGNDCVRGGPGGPGCATGLWLPQKSGSLDCTFCLDCVRACPSDNVGLVAVAPGSDLFEEHRRSSIGRLGRRPDVAALVLIVTFGAFANAAAMVAPVASWIETTSIAWRAQENIVFTVLFVAAVLALPLVAALTCAATGRAAGGVSTPIRELACDFAAALAPLGFGMWLAHLAFHLVTGFATAAPVVARVLGDLGLSGLGMPAWRLACCSPAAAWMPPVELLALDFGLLVTLYAAWRVAVRYHAEPAARARARVALGGACGGPLLRWRVDRLPTHADARDARVSMARRRTILTGLAVALAVACFGRTAWADGGAMRLTLGLEFFRRRGL
jgi:polyferredoxin